MNFFENVRRFINIIFCFIVYRVVSMVALHTVLIFFCYIRLVFVCGSCRYICCTKMQLWLYVRLSV